MPVSAKQKKASIVTTSENRNGEVCLGYRRRDVDRFVPSLGSLICGEQNDVVRAVV